MEGDGETARELACGYVMAARAEASLAVDLGEPARLMESQRSLAWSAVYLLEWLSRNSCTRGNASNPRKYNRIALAYVGQNPAPFR